MILRRASGCSRASNVAASIRPAAASPVAEQTRSFPLGNFQPVKHLLHGRRSLGMSRCESRASYGENVPSTKSAGNSAMAPFLSTAGPLGPDTHAGLGAGGGARSGDWARVTLAPPVSSRCPPTQRVLQRLSGSIRPFGRQARRALPRPPLKRMRYSRPSVKTAALRRSSGRSKPIHSERHPS